MMMNLHDFFEEKEIPFAVWDIKHDGKTHIVDSEYVIEQILRTKGIERHKICMMLFSLDFRNASILDYLKHLAECFIKENC